MGLFLLLYSWCCCFLSFSPSSSPSYFFLLCHSQWNEMCHQHAHPLYTPEQTIESGQNKRFYSCVCLCLCQETLSPCVVHAVGYMLHAPSEQKTFFFSFGLHLEPIPTGPDGLGGFVAGHHFQKSSLQSICIYQYQSTSTSTSLVLSMNHSFSLSCSIHEWLGIL